MKQKGKKAHNLELGIDALHEPNVETALNITVADRVHKWCISGVGLMKMIPSKNNPKTNHIHDPSQEGLLAIDGAVMQSEKLLQSRKGKPAGAPEPRRDVGAERHDVFSVRQSSSKFEESFCQHIQSRFDAVDPRIRSNVLGRIISNTFSAVEAIADLGDSW